MKIFTPFLLFIIIFFSRVEGQSYLINPTGDGGFESGTTIAANGWTLVNASPVQTNQWQCGTASTGYWGARCAYIGTDPGNNIYNVNSTSSVHFYRDVVFPAGISNIVLSFNWKGVGETVFDYLQVFMVPTTTVPVAGVMLPGNKIISGKLSNQSSWQSASFTLSNSLAGTTQRLVFSWRNDLNLGTAPAGAIDNISLTPGIPLPVSLVSFTATPDSKNEKVNCKWTTASETNNDFFTLEKSADGKIFQTFTQISATNTSYYHNYNFIDENPFNGISYYRLSQTDFNGSTQTLKTVSVSLKNKNSFSVECYPNVGSGEMTINATTPFTTLKIIDVDGKLLKNIFYPPGIQSVFLDLSDLKKGLYFIQAFSDSESSFEKIVIR
ncbi:MAG: T9SS type A sorting domain-containing protein [Bacteroidia bacterium]